jgi:DNA-binding transcriptional regulator YiaG
VSRKPKPKRAQKTDTAKKSRKAVARRALPRVLLAIHRNIRSIRKAKKISQRQLADAADASVTAVSHWERGLSAPVASRIPKVADRLGVTVDALYAEGAA